MQIGVMTGKESIYKQVLSEREFKELSVLIYNESGINLTENKKALLEGRLRKRVKDLNMDSFGSYLTYLASGNVSDDEMISLIDAVTTNKTDFFREVQHFDILAESVLHDLYAEKKYLNFWSAGCSTGEEPYTLAMVLSEYTDSTSASRYSIYATDICVDVLKKAVRAVYESDKIEEVPPALRKKYFMYSKDAAQKLVRVVPEIRKQVQFERLNLLESNYRLPDMMDVVFCRNVIIYFDKQTQTKVLANIISNIRPGGCLFLGHSEIIIGSELPVVRLGANLYRKIT